MMLNEMEILETIGHNLIEAIGKFAIGFAKALVTLVCLGGSIAYTTGQKLGKHFYKATHNVSRPATQHDSQVDTNTNIVQETKPFVANEQVYQPQPLELNNALSDVVNATDEIVDICHNINLVPPVVKTNSLEPD